MLASTSAPPPAAQGEDDIARLTGWRLYGARFFWIIAIFVNAISYLAGIPRAFQIAADLSQASIDRLAARGLPAIFPAVYIILLDSATFILFFVVAVIIFWRKSDQRLAIVTSLMLVFTGMLYTAPGYEARVPIWMVSAGSAFAETFQVTFLLLFPDGRWFPRWSWVAVPPLFLWRWWVWATLYIPWLYAAERTGDNYPFLRQDPRDLLALFVVVLIALLFQLYRYRRMSTRVQRQQTKWLIWSAGMAVALVGGYVLAINIFPSLLPNDAAAVFWRLGGRTVRQAALCLIPIALLRAILRDRLYDIDFVINRSLVYVPVTSILAGVFAAAAAASQRFFVATTGQSSDLAVIISTVLVTSLFQPVRSGIQSFVDSRMKESPDAYKKLRAFDEDVSSIADALDNRTLLTRLMHESVNALGAVGGAVYLVERDSPVLVASTPKWCGPLRIQMPLQHAGETLGWLALGERASGLGPYMPDERARLAQSCDQIARLLYLLSGIVRARPDSARNPERETGGAPVWEGVSLPLPKQ